MSHRRLHVQQHIVIGFIVVVGMIGMAVAPARAYPSTYTLNIPVYKQEQTNWCWAADLKMIMQYRGVNDSQCTIVAGVFGSPCSNNPAYEYQVQAALSQHNFSSYVMGAMSFDSLANEIYANRPFYAKWDWSGGGGHAVVIYGYQAVSTQYVRYADPGDGMVKTDTYNWLKNGPGHTYVATVYAIQ